MATGMHMDERSIDCLVLGHHDQDRKVSAKSVTMRAMTLCKNLSGYRELLLITKGADGVDTGLLKLFLLLYADEIVTFPESASGLQNSLNILHDYCQK